MRNRRIISLILTVVMILGTNVLGIQSVFADGTPPALVDSVYQIGTASELVWFAQEVNSGQGDINAKLIENIDLDSIDEWTPIGTLTNAFSGIFDGNGKTISNMSIEVVAGSHKGLFGIISVNGTVKDFTISNSIVSTSTTTANDSTYLGIVAGSNAGRIAGVKVVNSTVGGSKYLGGIAGQNTATGVIVACANVGTDIVQNVNADNGVGGIVGDNAGVVSVSYNNGNTTHKAYNYGYFGGIVGHASATTSLIENCYNTGDLSGGYYVGGISGNNATNSKITNCYNLGSVTATSSGTGTIFGSGTPVLTNSYYLADCLINGGSAGRTNGTSKTAEELKAFALGLGGAFVNDLSPEINNGYPILKWQDPASTFGVTLTVTPANATVVFTDGQNTIAPNSSDAGVYVFSGLSAGNYTYTVLEAEGDYVEQTGIISLDYADVSKTITLERRLYPITFNVTPVGTKFSITTTGFEETRTVGSEPVVFNLPVGTYEYTGQKFGYAYISDSVTVVKGSGANPVDVSLIQLARHTLTFNVTPSGSTITVTHPDDGVQTPEADGSYLLYETTYNYTIRLAGYLVVNGSVTIGNEDQTIDLQLTEGATAWDGSIAASFSGGDGTEGSPYQIALADELAYLASLVNSSNGAAYRTAYYKLTYDIDLNGSLAWTPIGSSTTYAFKGNFDGNGKTIGNMYIASGTYRGLFGYIGDGGIVKNLTITDASITGTTYIGAIAGSNAGTVSGVTVANSVVTGTNPIGGIVGINQTSGVVIASANIDTTVARSTDSGDHPVGGIVGDNLGKISFSYNSANIIRTSGASTFDGLFGGIAGRNNNAAASIDSCYNTGSVSPGYRSGGIVGSNATAAANISNSYNIGTVYRGNSSATYGGISGYQGTPVNCYYLDTSVGSDANSLGTRKDEAALRALAVGLGGAFVNDLSPEINNGYPILKWQDPNAVNKVILTVIPANAAVELKISGGSSIPPNSSDNGVYEFNDLSVGEYEYTVSNDNDDYTTQTETFALTAYADIVKTVTLNKNLYTVQFNVTPDDAVVTILGENMSKTAISGVASFTLPMGSYTYTVGKYGYVTDAGNLTVEKGVGAGPVTVNLLESATHNLTFDVSQNGSTITATHPISGVQTPTGGATYNLYEGETYNYKIRLLGYLVVNDSVTIGGSDQTISVTLVEGITAWDGVTAIEPSLIDNVYQISEGEHLAWFRNQVNAGTSNHNVNAILVNDIDLGGYEWVPISKYTSSSATSGYSGTFDGNEKAIRGLSITTGADGSGLFGYLFGATIKDLTVYGSIVAGQYSGGIAAIASGSGLDSNISSTISRCKSYVDITVNRNLSGSVNNTIYVGGIVGSMRNNKYVKTHGLIEYCINYGTILGGDNNYIGGIVGDSSHGVGVRFCGNEGDVSGQGRIGGISGSNGMLIMGCYNTGSIVGSNTSSSSAECTGGIVGFTNGEIAYCYNIGAVTGKTAVGGIVGQLQNTSSTTCTIDNSYNAGVITTVNDTTRGAIVGKKYSADYGQRVFDTYYISNTTGIGENAHANDEATLVTDEQLKDASMPDQLGGAFVYSEGNYPLVMWQVTGYMDAIIRFNVAPDDAVITVKNSENTAMSAMGSAGNSFMLPDGNYTYEITRTGFYEINDTFEIVSSNNMTFDLVMVKMPFAPEHEPIKVRFSSTDPYDDGFLFMKRNFEVYPGIAEYYNYSNDPALIGDGEISALDVLVSAHVAMFGEDIGTINEALALSYGFVSRAFGVTSSNIYTYVNGVTPHNGVLSGGYYTGYALSQMKLVEGDDMEFFFLVNAYPGDNIYGWFEQNGARITSVTAQKDTPLELTVKGYPNSLSYNMQELIDYSTAPLANASIFSVSIDEYGTGAFDDLVGTTDANGVASLTFNQPGVYVLSVVKDVGGDPLMLPWVTVTVAPAVIDMSFKDSNGEDATGLTNGGTLATATIVLENETDVQLVATVYVNDALYNVKIIDVTDEGTEESGLWSVPVDLSLPPDVSNTYVKLMMWDSIENMVPLSGTVKIP